jgi:hypothetical protein
MKLSRILLIAVASLVTSHSMAAGGTEDRDTQIAKYSSIMTDGSPITITKAAKDIYVSGLTDPGLARIVRELLLRDQLTKSTADRSHTQKELWLIKALASFGLAEDKETLKQFAERSRLASVRTECKDELALIDWHREKNVVMAGRENYRPDMDYRVLQLLNLLKSADFSYKHLAADRISWEKQLDPVLLDEIAAQLEAIAIKAKDRTETKLMGQYAKLLGHSENRKYLPVLETVNKQASSSVIKKHTRQAIERIDSTGGK